MNKKSNMSTVMVVFSVLLVLTIISRDVSATTSSASWPFGFIAGGSLHQNGGGYPLMTAVKATHARFSVLWGQLEKSLTSLNRSLTVNELRTRPDLIESWAAQRDWSSHDAVMSQLQKLGIQPIIEVGEGTFPGDALPLLALSSGNEDYSSSTIPADPNTIPSELYLAYQYRASRAAAMRYLPKGVQIWQTENELNEAWLAAAGGSQRYFNWTAQLNGGDGAPMWKNFTFLQELLHTLRIAVTDEAQLQKKQVWTTMNLHTDVPKILHDTLKLPGFYLDAAKEWDAAGLWDFASFDSYPNNLIASPSRTDRLSNITLELKHVIRSGLPIMCMETGYPVAAEDNPGMPTVDDFTAARQAQYATDSVNALSKAGASGILYYGLWNSQGIEPPEGPGTQYSADDIAALGILVKVVTTPDVATVEEAVAWATANFQYVSSGRLAKLVAGFWAGWGVADIKGNHRPAVAALASAFASVRS